MTNGQPNSLGALLGDFAIQIQDQADTQAALHAIVHGAVVMVPGAH